VSRKNGTTREQTLSADEVAGLLLQWMSASTRSCQPGGLVASLQVLDRLGATMPMTVVLHVLAFAGPQTMTQLSAQVGLSASATSHLLQRLVDLSLAQRHDVPADRRQRLLSITARGRRVVDDLMNARLTELRASLAPLSSLTRSRLGHALRAVLAELVAGERPVSADAGGATAQHAPPSSRRAPHRAPRRATPGTSARTSPSSDASRPTSTKRARKEKA
jgi:DNA-binding MarR family transcriptional regulator